MTEPSTPQTTATLSSAGAEFVPSPIPQSGPPARALAALAGAALLLMVAVGVLGPHDPSRPIAVAGATPSIAAVAGASPATTAPPLAAAGFCSTRTIAPLTSPIPRQPQDLVPPPVTLVASLGGPDQLLAPDRNGLLWSLVPGRRLGRLNPATGATTTWTFTDDPAFAASTIKPAREGGVWLVGPDAMRWFDGVAFRDVIPRPPDYGWLDDAAEAPDGSIWATVRGQGLYHWDGSSWTAACGNEELHDPNSVAVGPDGSVWVADRFTNTVYHYDARGGWLNEAPIPNGQAYAGMSIAVAADGALWVGATDGIARFDGAWTSEGQGARPLTGTTSLAVAADGEVWAVAASIDAAGNSTDGATVAALGIAGSRTFGVPDGLPKPAGYRQSITSIAVDGVDVFAATADGIYRLNRGAGLATARWSRIGPQPLAIPAADEVDRLVVGRGGDLWATLYSGTVWREHGGAWRRQPVPSFSGTTDSLTGLASGPDGTVAVASSAGVTIFGTGAPSVLDRRSAAAITYGPDGALWVAGGASDPRTGDPLPIRSVASFRRQGAGWLRRTLALPSGVTSVGALAIGLDESVWVRGNTAAHGDPVFWHLVRGKWTRLPPLAGHNRYPAWKDMVVDARGRLWTGTESISGSPPAARYDGSQWSDLRVVPPIAGYQTNGLGVAPDDTTWISDAGLGLVSLRENVASVRFLGSFGPIAVARGGAVYVAGPSGIYRLGS